MIPKTRLTKTLYKLANNYFIETEVVENKTHYEMYWENWGRKIKFSPGTMSSEDDFIYHVEYASSL